MGATIVAATNVSVPSVAGSVQTGRLNPDGIPSNCSGVLKFEPTVIQAGDAISFTNHTFRSRLTNPVCITITFPSVNACSIFSAAYVPGFNPSNILQNYAADLGSSTSSGGTYSFNVGAEQPFGVVVHTLTPGASCGGYNLTASSDRPWADTTPTLSGTPTPGSILTGGNATWVTTPPAQPVARQWVRCNASGASCADIAGATDPTYTVTDADVGSSLRFRNHVNDAGGTSTAQSRYVEPFIPFESHTGSLGPGDRVQNGNFVRDTIESRCLTPKTAPNILSAANSYLYDAYPVTSLLNEPTCLAAHTRAIASCGAGVSPVVYNPAFDPVAGIATNYAGNSGDAFGLPNLAVVPLGAGERREVVVSHGNSAGTCASYDVTLGATTPFATARPALSGTPVEGGTLTTTDGTWSGTPAIAYSWRRCDANGDGCTPIDGANSSTYNPTAADVGSRLRTRVTATQGQTVSSDSAPTEIVAAVPDQGGGGDGGGGGTEDRDPPDGQIRKVKVKGDDIKVKFRSDEPGSTFECRLDRKKFKPCTSPKRYRNLRDGKHRVFVLATDPAGNEDDKAAKKGFGVG